MTGKAIQRRRGTTAQHSTFTGLAGEVTVDTDKNTAVVHDGVTAGGIPVAKESALPAVATNAAAGKVKVSTNTSAQTGSASDEALRVVDAANNFLGQGLHMIGYWPARAMKPPTTSGAAALATLESTTNKINDEYLGFVNASTTYAGFSFRGPKKLDEAGTFIAEIEWTEAPSAAAHVCRWQVEMLGSGNADTIDTAWGTAIAVDATGSSGTRRFIQTAAITPGGSWAEGDKLHVRVARLGAHANDTLDVDARLIGVALFATINAKNDA